MICFARFWFARIAVAAMCVVAVVLLALVLAFVLDYVGFDLIDWVRSKIIFRVY